MVKIIPIRSMYGIFAYIWLIFMINAGKYTIHGSYGIESSKEFDGICVNSSQDEKIESVVTTAIYQLKFKK